MDKVDAVVVGAGVVGLAVARGLAQAGHETLVLERAAAIGTGVSSRNSEVIHAGLYYPAGSLKARLCVAGNPALYAFCQSHGVAHRRCGKLVVATEAGQIEALRQIQAKALANGVTDLQWLERARALALEPALRCEAALLSPSTGIVDTHALMLALQADLERAGGMVALHAELSEVQLSSVAGEGHVLHINAGGPDASALRADVLINAAGLYAPGLAARMQGLDAAHLPRAGFCKGSYFSLAGRAPFSRLIYPIPQAAGLGVHLTLDLGGQARFGPDTEWLDEASEVDALDYRVDAGRAQGFDAEVRRYWPLLPDGALRPAYSGVRPKIHVADEPAADFRIDGPAAHGVPGLVNLLGIESPGLTSCLALADEVLARLA